MRKSLLVSASFLALALAGAASTCGAFAQSPTSTVTANDETSLPATDGRIMRVTERSELTVHADKQVTVIDHKLWIEFAAIERRRSSGHDVADSDNRNVAQVAELL